MAKYVKKSRYREGGGALYERSGEGGAVHEREQQMSRSSKRAGAAHERARWFEALISLPALNPGHNQKMHEMSRAEH